MNQLTGAVAETRKGRETNDLMSYPKVLVDPGVEWFDPKGARPIPITRAFRRSLQPGSRAHVSRMVHRKKPFASIATHLAVWLPDGSRARIVHPAWAAYMQNKEVKGAHPVADARQGGQR